MGSVNLDKVEASPSGIGRSMGKSGDYDLDLGYRELAPLGSG
jgi:hypothetical protein